MTSKKKIVSVCSGKNDTYLVYRFGNQSKTELQFPTILDETSWEKFELYSYYRGGGRENAGMEEKQLSFSNNGVRYEIFENYSALSNKIEIGVLVTTSLHSYLMKGVLKTKKGDLNRIEGKVLKSDF